MGADVWSQKMALRPGGIREASDYLHAGGAAATRELAKLARLRIGQLLLDLGCGLGGSARLLNEEFKSDVIGLDRSFPFIAEAARRTGADSTRFLMGDVLTLPFRKSSFDLVWLQHVAMCVSRWELLLQEIVEVIKPGGTFACHEWALGSFGPLIFPVLWADNKEGSFLQDVPAWSEVLRSLAMRQTMLKDVSNHARAFYEERVLLSEKLFPESLHHTRNMIKNLMEDRLRCFYGVWTKANETKKS